MDQCVPAGANPLEDVAELLREELRDCHHFIKECFADATDREEYYATRRELMKLAARLMQASAVTAAALNRIQGNASRQEIVVTRASMPEGAGGGA